MQPLVTEQGEEGRQVAAGAAQAGARTHDSHLQSNLRLNILDLVRLE